MSNKRKINELDHIKIKNILHNKKHSQENERQPTEWKYFQIIYLIKISYSNYIANTCNSKRQFKNGQMAWVDISPHEIHKISTIRINCSKPLVAKEMQIQTTWNITVHIHYNSYNKNKSKTHIFGFSEDW